MSDSIFSKIIKGEIPSYKIYEDDIVVAFLDIMPAHEGHTLLVPKQECNLLWDLPDNIYEHLMKTAKHLAVKLEQAIDCKRIGLTLEGFDVPHAHLHLIPLNDGLSKTLSQKPDSPIDAAILKETQDKIVAVI